MRNYAQIIKEASYTGYDPKCNVDYEDDACMINDTDRKYTIRELRETAERFVMRWIMAPLREKGYVQKSIRGGRAFVHCCMENENEKMQVDIDLRIKPYHGFSTDVEIKICDRSRTPAQTRCEYFRIKVSTKNSKAKYIFRVPRQYMKDAKSNGEHWLLVICDTECNKVVEMKEYTDPFHQLKKSALDNVWYDPVYEPEWEMNRLPGLFYETMEKKQRENALLLPEVETIKARVTSKDGYLYFNLSKPLEFWLDFKEETCMIPKHVRVRCPEDVPSVQKKETLIVAVVCYREEDGVVVWLQAPEIRTEKQGVGVMPAGGFVYM